MKSLIVMHIFMKYLFFFLIFDCILLILILIENIDYFLIPTRLFGHMPAHLFERY